VSKTVADFYEKENWTGNSRLSKVADAINSGDRSKLDDTDIPWFAGIIHGAKQEAERQREIGNLPMAQRIWENAKPIMAKLPVQMAEYLLTAGAGKAVAMGGEMAAKTAAEAATRAAMKQLIKTSTGKASTMATKQAAVKAIRLAGQAAENAALALGQTLVDPRTAGAVAENLMEDPRLSRDGNEWKVELTRTDDDLTKAFKATGEKAAPEGKSYRLAKAVGKGVLNQFIENYSERLGSQLGPMTGLTGSTLSAMAPNTVGVAAPKLKAFFASRFLRRGGTTMPEYLEALKKVGYDGMINEMVEEVAAGQMRYDLGLQPDQHSLGTLTGIGSGQMVSEKTTNPEVRQKAMDQLLAEALAFSIPALPGAFGNRGPGMIQAPLPTEGEITGRLIAGETPNDIRRSEGMAEQPAGATTSIGPQIDAMFEPNAPEQAPELPDDYEPPVAQQQAPQKFAPTSEWQEVPEGAVLPPGLDIRMDMQSGKNFARSKEAAPPAAEEPTPLEVQPQERPPVPEGQSIDATRTPEERAQREQLLDMGGTSVQQPRIADNRGIQSDVDAVLMRQPSGTKIEQLQNGRYRFTRPSGRYTEFDPVPKEESTVGFRESKSNNKERFWQMYAAENNRGVPLTEDQKAVARVNSFNAAVSPIRTYDEGGKEDTAGHLIRLVAGHGKVHVNMEEQLHTLSDLAEQAIVPSIWDDPEMRPFVEKYAAGQTDPKAIDQAMAKAMARRPRDRKDFITKVRQFIAKILKQFGITIPERISDDGYALLERMIEKAYAAEKPLSVGRKKESAPESKDAGGETYVDLGAVRTDQLTPDKLAAEAKKDVDDILDWVQTLPDRTDQSTESLRGPESVLEDSPPEPDLPVPQAAAPEVTVPGVQKALFNQTASGQKTLINAVAPPKKKGGRKKAAPVPVAEAPPAEGIVPPPSPDLPGQKRMEFDLTPKPKKVRDPNKPVRRPIDTIGPNSERGKKAIATKAKSIGMSLSDLEPYAQDEWKLAYDNWADREGAKREARQLTNLDAGKIKRMENSGRKDYSNVPGFDEAFSNFQSSIEYEGNKSYAPTPNALWDFIREGAKPPPTVWSPEVLNAAAEQAIADRDAAEALGPVEELGEMQGDESGSATFDVENFESDDINFSVDAPTTNRLVAAMESLEPGARRGALIGVKKVQAKLGLSDPEMLDLIRGAARAEILSPHYADYMLNSPAGEGYIKDYLLDTRLVAAEPDRPPYIAGIALRSGFQNRLPVDKTARFVDTMTPLVDKIMRGKKKTPASVAKAVAGWIDANSASTEAALANTAFRDRKDWMKAAGDAVAARMFPVEDEPSFSVDQTKSPEFKKWFGESKVVDADGKPLAVYHGTDASDDFSSFSRKMIGEHGGVVGNGFYFSETPEVSRNYSQGRGGKTYKAYLSIQNPFDLSSFYTKSEVDKIMSFADPIQARHGMEKVIVAFNRDNLLHGLIVHRALRQGLHESILSTIDSAGSSADRASAVEDKGARFDPNTILEKAGFDGIVHANMDFAGSPGITETEYGNSWVAFHPNQIKSAIGNRGTFDAESDDINFSIKDTITGFIHRNIPASAKWQVLSQQYAEDLNTRTKEAHKWLMEKHTAQVRNAPDDMPTVHPSPLVEMAWTGQANGATQRTWLAKFLNALNPIAMSPFRSAIKIPVGWINKKHADFLATAVEGFRRLRIVDSLARQQAVDWILTVLDPISQSNLTREQKQHAFTMAERKLILDNLVYTTDPNGLNQTWFRVWDPDAGRFRQMGYGESLAAQHALDAYIAKQSPEMQQAIEASRARREALRKDLLTRMQRYKVPGVTDNALQNETYYHQMVLEYANAQNGSGKLKGMKNPQVSALRARQEDYIGTVFNTNFLEAEMEWVTDALRRLHVEQIRRETIQKKYDKTKEWRDQAYDANYLNAVGGQHVMDKIERVRDIKSRVKDLKGTKDNPVFLKDHPSLVAAIEAEVGPLTKPDKGEATKKLNEFLSDNDPLFEVRKSDGRDRAMLEAAGHPVGAWYAAGESADRLNDLVRDLYSTDPLTEDITNLAKAATRLLNSRRRQEMAIADKLADRGMTPQTVESIAKDNPNYEEWIPGPNNVFFRQYGIVAPLYGQVLTKINDAIKAGDIDEKVVQLIGVRKAQGMWLPKEIVAQLETLDQPVPDGIKALVKILLQPLHQYAKKLLLRLPTRFVKMEISNRITDSIQRFIISEGFLRGELNSKLKEANHLLEAMNPRRTLEMNPLIRAAIKHSVMSSGEQAFEMRHFQDVNQLQEVKDLLDADRTAMQQSMKALGKALSPMEAVGYWDFVSSGSLYNSVYGRQVAEWAAQQRKILPGQDALIDKLTNIFMAARWGEAREDAIRLGTFLYYRDHLEKTGGKLNLRSFADRNKVEALYRYLGLDSAAAYAARNTYGDYTDTSVFANNAAALLPFYRWTDTALGRTWWMGKNILTSDKTAGGKVLDFGRYILPQLLITLWNMNTFGLLGATAYGLAKLTGGDPGDDDPENSLSEDDKRRGHIILPFEWGGKQALIRNAGVMGDVLGTTGAMDAMFALNYYLRGEKSVKAIDVLEAAPYAAVQKMLSGLGPIPRSVGFYPSTDQSPLLALTSKIYGGVTRGQWDEKLTMAPGSGDQRPYLRPAKEVLARNWGFADEYDYLRNQFQPGSKHRDGQEYLMRMLVGLADKRDMALSDVHRKVDEWNKVHHKTDPSINPVSDYRDLRDAIKRNSYADFAAARKRLLEDDPTKTYASFTAHLRTLPPDNRIAKDDRQAFFDSLTPLEKDHFEAADSFARDASLKMWSWWHEAAKTDSEEVSKRIHGKMDTEILNKIKAARPVQLSYRMDDQDKIKARDQKLSETDYIKKRNADSRKKQQEAAKWLKDREATLGKKEIRRIVRDAAMKRGEISAGEMNKILNEF
jgi:hypothetical protein